MTETKDTKAKPTEVIKEDPNLITVFICFLRSGLRFTRYDTNNVGLDFIEEIKKHNPNFKPVKVQQRERHNIYTVNAYPKEFEQLIMSLIEEYRKKHNLEYRLKKPAGARGKPGFSKDQRGGYRPRGEMGAGNRYGGQGTQDRVGGYRKRRDTEQKSGESSHRHVENRTYNQPYGKRQSADLGEYKPSSKLSIKRENVSDESKQTRAEPAQGTDIGNIQDSESGKGLKIKRQPYLNKADDVKNTDLQDISKKEPATPARKRETND
jgi:hypothetical protein